MTHTQEKINQQKHSPEEAQILHLLGKDSKSGILNTLKELKRAIPK